MPRKRVERPTSYIRYKIKVMRDKGQIPPVPLLDEFTDMLWAQREGAWANYRKVWDVVKKVLAAEGIPSVMYVAYRAAAFEYYNKVLLTHDKTPEAWFDKWDKRGLDPRVLAAITGEVEKAVGSRPF